MKSIRRFSKVLVGMTIMVSAQLSHAQPAPACSANQDARVAGDACIDPALAARKQHSFESNTSFAARPDKGSLIDDFDFGGHAALMLAGVVAVLSLSRRRQLH